MAIGFLCLLPALGAAVPARAQVLINPAALVQLAGVAPQAATASPPRPATHRSIRRIARRPTPPVVAAVARSAPPAPTPVVARPPPKPVVIAPVALRFAAGSAALPGNAAAALRQICTQSGGFVAVDATAPGDPSDPSVAMRLSLARALAVRDALTACGIPGTRILPRALGDLPGRDDNAALVTGAAKP
jgi:hypothetical protein